MLTGDMVKESAQKDLKSANFYFCLQAIASLLPYNAVMSTIYFFSAQFPGKNVFFYFIPVYVVPVNIINFLMVWIRRKQSLDVRVGFYNSLAAVVFAVMPVIAFTMSDSNIGFFLILACLFCIGLFQTISQSSVVGIAGFFPQKSMSWFSFGFGVAGLLTNFIQLIFVAASNGQEKALVPSTSSYYGITAACLIYSIFNHYKFSATKYAKDQIEQKGRILEAKSPQTAGESESEGELALDAQEGEKEMGIWENMKVLYDGFLAIKGLSTAMLVIYIQTYLVYPGVMLLMPMTGIDGSMGSIVVITVFHLADALGRYLTQFQVLLSKRAIKYLVALRFVLIGFFILRVTNPELIFLGSNWSLLLNVIIFTMLNGYLTAELFMFAPQEVRGSKKEIAGFLQHQMLCIGILVGSLLALPLANLNK